MNALLAFTHVGLLSNGPLAVANCPSSSHPTHFDAQSPVASAVLLINGLILGRRRRNNKRIPVALVSKQQDRLLDARLMDEIGEGIFASKNAGLRDRIARCKLQVDAADFGGTNRRNWP